MGISYKTVGRGLAPAALRAIYESTNITGDCHGRKRPRNDKEERAGQDPPLRICHSDQAQRVEESTHYRNAKILRLAALAQGNKKRAIRESPLRLIFN